MNFQENPVNVSKYTAGFVHRAPIVWAPTGTPAASELAQDYRKATFKLEKLLLQKKFLSSKKEFLDLYLIYKNHYFYE